MKQKSSVDPRPESPVDSVAGRLRERYGELLTDKETAAELKRTPASLRFLTGQAPELQSPWVRALLAGRIRMGRRICYQSGAVARVLTLGDAAGDVS